MHKSIPKYADKLRTDFQFNTKNHPLIVHGNMHKGMLIY